MTAVPGPVARLFKFGLENHQKVLVLPGIASRIKADNRTKGNCGQQREAWTLPTAIRKLPAS